MDTWYSKELGDAITASMPSDEIEAVFQQLFVAAGKPLNMAVFTRQESEGHLHCEVTAYFSPAAVDVAKVLMHNPVKNPRCQVWGCWQVIHSRGRYSSLKGIEHVSQESSADALRLASVMMLPANLRHVQMRRTV